MAREGSEREEKAVQIRISEHKYTPYHAPPSPPSLYIFFNLLVPPGLKDYGGCG